MAEPRAVILYGPPASGKDTITEALTQIGGTYRLFHRLKCGPGRTAGYRIISPADLQRLRAFPGEVIWEARRYGATYVIDRTQLEAELLSGAIPVVHLGQPAGADEVIAAFPTARILVVALTCSRHVAASRIAARETGDGYARLAAYDDTEPLPGADVTIDTGQISVVQAAATIDSAVRRLK